MHLGTVLRCQHMGTVLRCQLHKTTEGTVLYAKKRIGDGPLFIAMRNCTGQAFKRLLNTVKAQLAA